MTWVGCDWAGEACNLVKVKGRSWGGARTWGWRAAHLQVHDHRGGMAAGEGGAGPSPTLCTLSHFLLLPSNNLFILKQLPKEVEVG